MPEKPVVICLTPVRNEAWILDTFLQCASMWADHIIVADQNSTDGSKEIAAKYPKVILVENKVDKYDEYARQQLLLTAARKIPGKRLLIALDADEFLTADFWGTNDWQLLLNAERGSAFAFKWINVEASFKNGWNSEHFPFALMDDESEHTGRLLHSTRVPVDPTKLTNLDQIQILHYQYTNWERMKSKHRYYQCLERINFPEKDPIGIYRMYHHMDALSDNIKFKLKDEWFESYEKAGIHVRNLKFDEHYWFDEEVLKFFVLHGTRAFRKEAIWDVDWNTISTHFPNVGKKSSDPRSIFERMVQSWLKKTQPKASRQIVKRVDRLLDILYFPPARKYLFYNKIGNILREIRKNAKAAETPFVTMLIRTFLYFYKRKRIYAYKNVAFKGLNNIVTKGELKIGLQQVGFSHKGDKTFFNVRGSLVFEGSFSVGKGCRFDIGPNAKVVIGKDGYVTANTSFIISHGLSIGDNCAISWDCQFLDDDFHNFEYEGKKSEPRDPAISIGNNVWIGCNTFIYKGASIPNGCIVASNSVVKCAFTEENVLIAGNPAKIIKRNVRWS